jgi:hypothetical protein
MPVHTGRHSLLLDHNLVGDDEKFSSPVGYGAFRLKETLPCSQVPRLSWGAVSAAPFPHRMANSPAQGWMEQEVRLLFDLEKRFNRCY